MNYLKEELTFASSDGKSRVYSELYLPSEKEVIGIIQISHGMVDHIGRYYPLAEYFCPRGFVVAGNHHLGHGKTAACEEDLGYFGEKNNVEHLITDIGRMNFKLKEKFPGVPVFLLGHSMGSFLARLYAVENPEEIDGLIIHGTGGPNPLLPFGKALARVIRKFKGQRYRSSLVTSLAFGAYNRRFPKEEGRCAWLTRDVGMVSGKDTDPYGSFTFTTGAYLDLFDMIGRANSKEWFENYPRELPTLILSGTDDPVGDYGRGVEVVRDRIAKSGNRKLSSKLYAGARHELFNETNRQEVFGDIEAWLGGIRK